MISGIRFATPLKLLFSQPFYLALAILLAVLLFFLYFFLNNISVFTSIFAVSSDPVLLWRVFANQVGIVWTIGGPFNVLATGGVSILAGTNLSLTVLRVRKVGGVVGGHGVFATLGSFVGAFGAGCAACQTALISVLGISGGLAIFPFQGLEISLLALLLLSVSLYYVSKSLVQLGVVG